jgi:hypothetical protein
VTDLVAALAAAIERARIARAADLCPLAVCRGRVRTVFMAEPDGDVQPYGYCTSCGMPVS